MKHHTLYNLEEELTREASYDPNKERAVRLREMSERLKFITKERKERDNDTDTGQTVQPNIITNGTP